MEKQATERKVKEYNVSKSNKKIESCGEPYHPWSEEALPRNVHLQGTESIND